MVHLIQYIVAIRVLQFYCQFKILVMEIVEEAAPAFRGAMPDDGTVRIIDLVIVVDVQVFDIARQNGFATSVRGELCGFCGFGLCPYTKAYKAPE